ncbi:MAG TPA: LLM class flavin-dependent oxidoreductase [Acidimicrobiales bacterium]|nr:LLM class flavin-dependent oxidoreductase [Acidimicrobiales bacterium]
MRVGLVILPSDRWRDARRQWEWADDVGFTAAWTYDHIRWNGMPEGPWLAAIPVLAAAAGVTRRIRLGTLVATPNFRHPVTLARDVIALDDLSGGRFDLGLGPGSEGHDATSLGQVPWAPAERMARFAQFLQVLRPILDGEPGTRTSLATGHYAAEEVPSTPGTVQSPLPLTIAAGGPRGLRQVVGYGQHWVTIGPTGRRPRTPELILAAVRKQCAQLAEACSVEGRDPASLGRVILWTPAEPELTSADQFDELAAPYAELGFDQFVLHHPAQSGPYGGAVKVFEQIASIYNATR